MSDTFKTKAGTVLPLLNLKEKLYLQVAHRIMWFREEHPNYGIETEILNTDQNGSVVRARIKNEDGRVIAMGTKAETVKGFADHLEKAETGAIGRALALIGYGTQFALLDFDEGERLADTPHEAPKPAYKPNTEARAPQKKVADKPNLSALFGHPHYDWVIPKGKFEGQRMGNLSIEKRTQVAEFFNKDGEPKGWCREFVDRHNELCAYELGNNLGPTSFAQTPPPWASEPTGDDSVPF